MKLSKEKVIKVDLLKNIGILLNDLATVIDFGFTHKMGQYNDFTNNPFTEFIPRVSELYIKNQTQNEKNSFFEKLNKLDKDIKLVLFKGSEVYIDYLENNLKKDSVMRKGSDSYLDWWKMVNKVLGVKEEVEKKRDSKEKIVIIN